MLVPSSKHHHFALADCRLPKYVDTVPRWNLGAGLGLQLADDKLD
jgi:hypothetical protein